MGDPFISLSSSKRRAGCSGSRTGYLARRKGKVPGLDVRGGQVNTGALGTPTLGSVLGWKEKGRNPKWSLVKGEYWRSENLAVLRQGGAFFVSQSSPLFPYLQLFRSFSMSACALYCLLPDGFLYVSWLTVNSASSKSKVSVRLPYNY